jgi:hypothetical protein
LLIFAEVVILDENRKTKNNHRAIFSTSTRKKTPDKKWLVDMYNLQFYIDGPHLSMYRAPIVDTKIDGKVVHGIMLSRSNAASILLSQGYDDKEKYLSWSAKLQGTQNTWQEDQNNQELSTFNLIVDAAKDDADVLLDHILYMTPKPIVPYEVNDADTLSLKLSD